MKKKILGIAVAIVMLFAVVNFSGCSITTLAEYQVTAIETLESYADSKKDNFSARNWLIVQEHVDAGRVNINAATDKEAVQQALGTAKQLIGAVPQSLLTEEIIEQIKQDAITFVFSDFSNTSIENIAFFYYGSFNGSIVVMLQTRDGFWDRSRNWDNFKILYPNSLRPISRQEQLGYQNRYPNIFQFIEIHYPDSSRVIRAWNNGNFYRLFESYEQDLLTVEDIKQIAKIHYYEGFNVYRDNGTWF